MAQSLHTAIKHCGGGPGEARLARFDGGDRKRGGLEQIALLVREMPQALGRARDLLHGEGWPDRAGARTR